MNIEQSKNKRYKMKTKCPGKRRKLRWLASVISRLMPFIKFTMSALPLQYNGQ